MTHTLLAVGDIHLGSRPASIPDGLRKGLAEELDPYAVWMRTVEEAIRHDVAAVLLVGDVVHDLNDAWRAADQLDEGVRRLAEHGIRVISVVGNHDIKALPIVAQSIHGLELIGADGQWR